MKVATSFNPCPRHQPGAFLAQAAPVSTTWYTVLTTSYNVRLISIEFEVRDTGEDLELEIAIDGETYTVSIAAVANTVYTVYLHRVNPLVAAVEPFGASTTDFQGYRAFLLEGRSVQVRIRKTSAAGAGNLNARVLWARWG